MGALTLKSLAFYLRNWDTEKVESVDPTDGFGSNTRIYISNNKIVQIEPEYNNYSFNTWLTDKSRQFFDGIFYPETIKNPGKQNKNNLTSKPWFQITKDITKVLYLYNHCNYQKYKKYFFTIIFENVSIEILSLLIVISQNYSFINLKRAENFNINNDLESNFHLNLTTKNKIKLTNSSTCLLISTNPRYEGYLLNLSLRQRFFKGNFKCFLIGSVINLTFPVVFIGSNTNSLKSISEGKNLICQSLRSSKNPLFIYNSELTKRVDRSALEKIFKVLKYSNILNQTWNNLNSFSSTLSETGIQSMSKILPVTKKDITNFSVLYWLNVNTNNISNFKKLANFKLISLKLKTLKINRILIDQGLFESKNLNFCNRIFDSTKLNYFFSKSSMFYENEEMFINTEGLIKRTTKNIFRKKTKNQWQLLRKLLKHLRTNLNFLDFKNNNIISFDLKNKNRFKNFIYFQYQATQCLNNLNFFISVKSHLFNLTNNNLKNKQHKLVTTKLRYWLDDFYGGGKDNYSQESLIMNSCSKLLRGHSTNFF